MITIVLKYTCVKAAREYCIDFTVKKKTSRVCRLMAFGRIVF